MKPKSLSLRLPDGRRLSRAHSTIPLRKRHPSHRHAAPSGPWPWLDIDLESYEDTNESPESREALLVYPQSHFKNWTPLQVRRSGIKEAIGKECTCDIYAVDVLSSGKFEPPVQHTVTADADSKRAFEQYLATPRGQDNRVRALCVENMSGTVLQMLGSHYNIEPFFFSSSLNRIPSRYQSALRPAKEDHITIILTFLRKMDIPAPAAFELVPKGNRGIDTHDPLYLCSERGDSQMLFRDLLSLHMVRSIHGSTIISYHASPESGRTSAKNLQSRVHLAGKSVYWTNIFNNSRDPTFVLLTILWHALYSWDEALSCLYEHITDQESTVITTGAGVLTQRTQELHRIRAHLLHYTSLLNDFKKSVLFIMNNPNPAMDFQDVSANGAADMLTKEESAERLKTECNNLLSEIERLEMSRSTQNKRLKNLMNLAFSTVNIEDSKTMQELTTTALRDSHTMKQLTQAAVQDSAAMKQIAYLTMIFLPSSFVAAVFGMNVTVINPDSKGTLGHYVAVALPLTLVTIWAVIAFNPKKDYEGQRQASLSKRFAWPIRASKKLLQSPSKSLADYEAQNTTGTRDE